MNKWFVQIDEQVQGPFTAEDVQSRLSAGQLRQDFLIWGPVQDEWRQIQWWLSNYNNLLATIHPIAPVEEWHFSLDGASEGPMSRLELVHALKGLKSLSDVLIWKNGMVSWVSIYEFHDILTEVGVSKREFPRADLVGKGTVKVDSRVLSGELTTISEGGFGLVLAEGVMPGQLVVAEIHSPVLREVIHAKAECRYAAQGVMGFRFQQLSMEYKGAIVQYVRHAQSQIGMKKVA